MGLLDRITRPFFGGSTQSSNSQSSAQSQSGLDPRFANQFFSNLTNVQNTAGDLKAREFAGFTPDQMAGFGQVRQTAMNGPGFGSINQAAGALADGTGYNPMMIGPAPTVKAGSFLGSDIGSYMSPYLDKVAGSTMNQLERQRQIALTGNNAAATAAGAYGGSRHGIVDAETNRNFFDVGQQAMSSLYDTGFGRATALQASDMDRGMDAEKFNAGTFQQGAIANQGAGLQGQQLRQGAATNLANVGTTQQNAGYQAGEALTNIGGVQQGFTQQQMDAIRSLPLERQQLIAQALGLNVGGGSGMQSNSTQSSSSSSKGSMSKGIFESRPFSYTPKP